MRPVGPRGPLGLEQSSHIEWVAGQLERPDLPPLAFSHERKPRALQRLPVRGIELVIAEVALPNLRDAGDVSQAAPIAKSDHELAGEGGRAGPPLPDGTGDGGDEVVRRFGTVLGVLRVADPEDVVRIL